MDGYKNKESIVVEAGIRTYFLDVKQTRGGNKYLKITESKRIDNGDFERHNVLIFEEEIYKMFGAFQTILTHFPPIRKQDGKSRMEQLKEKYANAYKPWSEEEDFRLTELFCQGKRPKEISELLQRNTGAINSRIEKLELKEKYG